MTWVPGLQAVEYPQANVITGVTQVENGITHGSPRHFWALGNTMAYSGSQF